MMNRKFKLLLFFMFCVSIVFGQSLYWETSTKADTDYSTRALSRDLQGNDSFAGFALHQNSYFLTGGATFNLSDSPTFDEQLQIEGALIANIFPSFNLFGTTISAPIRGNIFALVNQDSLTTFEGGIYPFGQLADSNENYDIIIHGGFEGKWDPSAEGFEQSDRSWRGFLGGEFVWLIKNQTETGVVSKPIVVGAAGVIENVAGVDQNNVGAEFTTTFQIVDGFALLARYYQRFQGVRLSGFQIGVGLSSQNLGIRR